MEHDIFIDISRRLGEIAGILETHMSNQEKTNETLGKILEKHDVRISGLESIKNKVVGAIIVSACGGSGIAVALTKVFGL